MIRDAFGFFLWIAIMLTAGMAAMLMPILIFFAIGYLTGAIP